MKSLRAEILRTSRNRLLRAVSTLHRGDRRPHARAAAVPVARRAGVGRPMRRRIPTFYHRRHSPYLRHPHHDGGQPDRRTAGADRGEPHLLARHLGHRLGGRPCAVRRQAGGGRRGRCLRAARRAAALGVSSTATRRHKYPRGEQRNRPAPQPTVTRWSLFGEGTPSDGNVVLAVPHRPDRRGADASCRSRARSSGCGSSRSSVVYFGHVRPAARAAEPATMWRWYGGMSLSVRICDRRGASRRDRRGGELGRTRPAMMRLSDRKTARRLEGGRCASADGVGAAPGQRRAPPARS